MELGRAILGSWFSAHVEHFRSPMAWRISLGHPSCRQNSVNFIAPGWPRFRWTLRSHAWVSGFNIMKRGPCFWEARSMTWRSIDSVFSGSETLWATSIGSWVRGRFGSGSDPSNSAERTARTSAEDWDCTGTCSETGISWPTTVLALANMVRLTLAGVPFRRKPLNVSFSQGSHSSSTTTSSCLRRMQMRFLRGALPGGTFLVGPGYRSVPRQRTTCLISCSGHNMEISWMISPVSITSGPTRGAITLARLITVCQLASANRCAMACGLNFDMRRLFLVGCSLLFSWEGGSSIANTGFSFGTS